MWIIVVIIIIILIGLTLLSGHSPVHKRTRMEFLEELAKFLEGKLEPISDRPNSFVIHFNFEGESFTFEDIEEKSFKGNRNRVFLKAQTPANLTLIFTEKEMKATTGHMVIASEIPDELIPEMEKIEVPDRLKEFNIFSKTITKANEFFQDRQMAQIIADFKNVNERGYHSVSLKIIDGVVSLEFLSGLSQKPSLEKLYSSIASVENVLEQILPVVKRLKWLV